MTHNRSSRADFEKLFNNEMSESEARDFLVALYEKGESSEDVSSAASVMREHSIKVILPEALRTSAIDIVGTGGDKSGSFNISTTVSLLLASMGVKVAKHGNRSITSKSGSTDVLEALGIALDLTVENKVKLLEECGFCFFPATDHHPAMKHIMPIRKSIDHRTIFNILGPLTNPAGVERYMLGVFHPSFIQPMAEALVALGVTKAYVVSSQDGMDELSISAKSNYAFIDGDTMLYGVIDPEEYGFSLAPKEEILGGDAITNATITKEILSGKMQGAKRDVVVLNAAFALHAEGSIESVEEGIKCIQAHLDSGEAMRHLEKLAQTSQALAK
jgi:anthranilate phosphoribosyltransferase